MFHMKECSLLHRLWDLENSELSSERGRGSQILGNFFIFPTYFNIFSTYFFISSTYFFISPTYFLILSAYFFILPTYSFNFSRVSSYFPHMGRGTWKNCGLAICRGEGHLKFLKSQSESPYRWEFEIFLTPTSYTQGRGGRKKSRNLSQSAHIQGRNMKET